MKTTTSKILDKKLRENHQKDLGFTIPEDYFEESKTSILASIHTPKKGYLEFWNKKNVWYAAAAILIVFLTVNILQPSLFSAKKEISTVVSDTLKGLKNETNLEFYKLNATNDISIASLFVEEEDVNDLVDTYMIESLLHEDLKVIP